MTSTGLTSGSASYPVTASGAASQIAFTANNSPQNVPGPIVLTATVQDAAGNRVFGNADSLTFSTTTAGCSATFNTGTATTSAGSTNPFTQAASNGARTVNAWDSVAQSCVVKVTDNVTAATATTTVSFTGFVAPATKLTESNSPPATSVNPLPADGVSTTTATICVSDASGNTVTSGTGSTDPPPLAKTTNNGATTQVTSSPQTAVNGCVQYTIRSNARAAGLGQATDAYTATDASRTLTQVIFNKVTNAP
jgi:hypothetical protein